jgi:hypothetical protein
MNDREMTQADLAELGRVKKLLENPSFIAKVAEMIGTPVEKAMDLLPQGAATAIQKATRAALEKGLQVAVSTLRESGGRGPSNIAHKIAVGMTGAAGGAFGIASLPLELPVTTTVMLRSIAQIARSKGEDPHAPETAVACLEVLSLGGGPPAPGDASGSAYFAVRATLAEAASEAAAYIADKGKVDRGAPALVRLLTIISARFGAVVAEKAAAEIVPVIGGAGGAAVNVAFMIHFQDMAEGHFTVRRLEREYGAEVVRAAYDRLPR